MKKKTKLTDEYLSGFKIMWMIVMFDLPTETKRDKQNYTQFRNFLLDNGFMRAQFSVYFRMLSNDIKCETMVRKIKKSLPPAGKVDILQITDKQYENIVSFNGKIDAPKENPSQLALF